ncbi:MAG: hypothetical protein GQ533_09100 [Methanosarcinaceae archaeon]|nr:hypothetical protein [Methanosarcinaceae archaeon]
MKTRNGMRIISVLMTLLLVSAMAMPAMACMPSAQPTQDGDGSTSIGSPCSQGINIGDDSDVKVETTELSGMERNKAIAQALSDKSVLELRKELIKAGYKPSMKETSAVEGTTTNDDGTITTTIVGMPFSGKNENDTAVITFVSNELGNVAIASVVSNGMIMILNHDPISGDVQIQSLECDICLWAVSGICNFLANKACSSGCATLCLTVPNPLWVAVCFTVCYVTCRYIVAQNACNWGAGEVCEGVGLC